MLKIALISDELTRISLELEDNIQIYNITPLNYWYILKFIKPDFLFVESAWSGYKGSWKYKIASYPDVLKRNNDKLKKVIEYAKHLNIPSVFWNKEDSIHFERFVESALLCDYIFTVDITAIKWYQELTNIPVNTLMFAIQPKIHNFSGFDYKYKKANFVGSYSKHIHPQRREWQNMFFNTLCKNDFDIDIYNRNSDRNPKIYGYPKLDCLNEKEKITYKETAQIYKDYLVSLNVNTITNSSTMFSRRLIEILACGRICITNPSMSVNNLFREYCYITNNEEELSELIKKIKIDGIKNEKEKLKSGSEYILKYHTWKHRLEEIKNVIGI